jgi:DNA-binding PucR family transcriptional regulator
VVAAEPVVVANDHLAEMVVAADPALLAELAERILRPLDSLPLERRRTLEETLSVWLGHDGDRSAVAAALVVHPQTVSYRMAQLRAELGDSLANPRDRLALRLALLGRGVHLK